MDNSRNREKVEEAIQKIPGVISKETVRAIDGKLYVNVGEEDIRGLNSKQFEQIDLPSVTVLLGFPLTSRLNFSDNKTKEVKKENGLRIKVNDPSVRFVPTWEGRQIFDAIKKAVTSKTKEDVQIIFLGPRKLSRAFIGEVYYLDGRNGAEEYRADDLAMFG